MRPNTFITHLGHALWCFPRGLKWGIGEDSCFFGNHGHKRYVISVVWDTPDKHNRMLH